MKIVSTRHLLVQLPALRPWFTITQQVHVFYLNCNNLLGKNKPKQIPLSHPSHLLGKGLKWFILFLLQSNTQPLHYFLNAKQY